MPTLRARQTELARQSIIDACADLVTERHRLDFTMQDVAARAGVSLRTVYNHFEKREDLLDALNTEFDRRSSAMGGPEARELNEFSDLLNAMRINTGIFEAMGGISEAMAQMPLADIGRDQRRTERTRLIVDFIASQMPGVPERDATVIAIVLRHLLSHRSWFWLTREYGLDNEDFVDVTTWIISTLTEAAVNGDLPKREEHS